MGNGPDGPGDFEDYFQMIQDNDKMCGGFVWEWCDHAIAHGTAENGKTIYAYGGDHGEEIHDGNFCMDGLVYPDGTDTYRTFWNTRMFIARQELFPITKKAENWCFITTWILMT